MHNNNTIYTAQSPFYTYIVSLKRAFLPANICTVTQQNDPRVSVLEWHVRSTSYYTSSPVFMSGYYFSR